VRTRIDSPWSARVRRKSRSGLRAWSHLRPRSWLCLQSAGGTSMRHLGKWCLRLQWAPWLQDSGSSPIPV